MYRQKKFSNNHILAGATALFYNVHLDTFFETDKSVKTDFVNKITDIGFEWKLSSSQSWTSVSLKVGSLSYFTSLNQVNDGGSEMPDGYMCQRYTSYENTGVYPTRVMIKNLSPGLSYDVRSYYITDGTKKYYNAQSTTLLSHSSQLVIEDPTYSTSATENVSEEDLEEFTNRIVQACSMAVEMYALFTSLFDRTMTLKIDYDATGNWAARAGGSSIDYNAAFRSESLDGVRSVLVHELAHNNMVNDHNVPNATYKDKIIKFMEFATNAPYAMWKWQGSHCYPVISSNRYSYIDDCLVVAACELSRNMY